MIPKQYILSACHQWISDEGLQPHIFIAIDENVSLPKQFMSKQTLLLNVSYSSIEKEYISIEKAGISFGCRFSGAIFNVFIPLDNVLMIMSKDQSIQIPFVLMNNGEKSVEEKSTITEDAIETTIKEDLEMAPTENLETNQISTTTVEKPKLYVIIGGKSPDSPKEKSTAKLTIVK